MPRTVPPLFAAVLLPASSASVSGQEASAALPPRIALEDAAQLAKEAREAGDPARGALVFFRPSLQSATCHDGGDKGKASAARPDLTTIGRPMSDKDVVESILDPSKRGRPGFEPVSLALRDAQSGLAVGFTTRSTTCEIHVRIRRAR